MIECKECKKCNRKGKPSVMRGSAYCDSHIIRGIRVNRVGLFQRFKDLVFERRYDEKENKMRTNRGFRPSWFWR